MSHTCTKSYLVRLYEMPWGVTKCRHLTLWKQDQALCTVVTSVNAWWHIYTRLMSPLLIAPQLLCVIKHICPSPVSRSYELLAELLVSQFVVSGTTSLTFKMLYCPNGLVSVGWVTATRKSSQKTNKHTTLWLQRFNGHPEHPVSSQEQHWVVQQVWQSAQGHLHETMWRRESVKFLACQDHGTRSAESKAAGLALDSLHSASNRPIRGSLNHQL